MTEFRTLTYPGWNKPGIGQHSVELCFALIGEQGAIVWRLALGIAPIGVYPTRGGSHNITALYNINTSEPCDMGLSAHSELNERTMHDDSLTGTDSCEFLQGRACVCDMYTGLAGAELMPAFACEGFDGVRKILERKYLEHYGEPA